MTYEEGLAWLASKQGGLTRQTRHEVQSVVAFAHNLASSTVPRNFSDPSEVRRCELEAIEELKQIIED